MPGNGMRILLLGGDTDHNVGDRAIASAIVHCLVAHDARTEVSIVSGHSSAPPIRGVTRTIPRGIAGFASLCREVAAADRVLVAGGGLFQDDDSRMKMPYWAARLSALKLFNSRIAGLSIGAGPLDHAESRLAARVACSTMTTISVRDRLAKQALEHCTSKTVEVVPDPAFMLEPAPQAQADAFLRGLGLVPGQPIIAVAARRWFHARGGFVPNVVKARVGLAPRRDAERLDRLVDTLAEALRQLAKCLDAAVLLLPSYDVAHEGDGEVCAAIARRLHDVPVRHARVTDPQLYKAVLGRASLLVASRMHPLILGAGMGIPLVGLGYNQKFDGLFDLLGTPRRLLALDDFPERWDVREILSQAEAALHDWVDLRSRADALADRVRRRTIELSFNVAPEVTLRALDA